MSRPDVAQAAAELARCLDVAARLTARPDTIAANGPGLPAGPAQPWNTAAANACLDGAREARDLEHELRAEVTGRPQLAYRTRGRARGGSDGNTVKALAAVVALAEAVGDQDAADVARRLGQRAAAVQRLPAVDTAEPWRRVAAACPYCGYAMLGVAARSGLVHCLRGGACLDADGRPPAGSLDVSRLTGDAVIVWQDGLITP
ncbi:MAG TPA: hypothetical protein VK586_22750 [Streptosporangiaceae bacterium]|nr:hypothetical protein [Streptosporangiaceae bacterium]